MFAFEIKITIDRPKQEVFDSITNPENDSKWREYSVSVKWTEVRTI